MNNESHWLIHTPTTTQPDTKPESGTENPTSNIITKNVDVVESELRKGIGYMFSRTQPNTKALVLPYNKLTQRIVHSVFVPFEVDVLWINGVTVTHKKQLHAWFGFGKANADMIVELPAGEADNISIGDKLEVLDEEHYKNNHNTD